MPKKIDFYNTDFNLTGNYKVIKVTINDFKIDDEEHNASEDKINNGPFYIKLNEPIDIEKYQVFNVLDINYIKEDKTLDIDGVKYRIIDDSMLEEFVNDVEGDFEDCIENLMNHFIPWFLNNIGIF